VCVDAGPCRPPRLPASLGADDPVRAHEALHAAPWHGLAGPQQGLPHPPIAVGAVVGRVQFAGASEQPLVGDGPRAALAARAPRLGGRRHAQVRHTGSTPKRSRCVSMNALASVGLVEPLGENTDADSRISFARADAEIVADSLAPSEPAREELADERAALRSMATLVAASVPPGEILRGSAVRPERCWTFDGARVARSVGQGGRGAGDRPSRSARRPKLWRCTARTWMLDRMTPNGASRCQGSPDA
jgi:hypothetical protein